MNRQSLHRFSVNDLHRMQLLKNNVIDLSIAIDDFDQELAPMLAERARLAALLDEACAELQHLIGRAA